MFPRTSSFAQEEKARRTKYVRKQADVNPESPKGFGPSREELERWYDALNDLLDRESQGDVDHTTELTDLRDEIYAYLH